MGPLALRRLAAALILVAALPAAEFTTYLGDTNPYPIARVITDASGNTYAAGSRTFNLSSDPVRPHHRQRCLCQETGPSRAPSFFPPISAARVTTSATGWRSTPRATSTWRAPPVRPISRSGTPINPPPGPGFIAKFSPDGLQLLYSTYFPAAINALAVDAAGNMYVTGSTNLSTFPVTAGLPHGGVTSGIPMVIGAFVTKLAATGDRIVWSTLFAGSDKNCGCCSSCFTSFRNASGVGIAVDPAGNAYVAGNTDTLNLPSTPGAMLGTRAGSLRRQDQCERELPWIPHVYRSGKSRHLAQFVSGQHG